MLTLRHVLVCALLAPAVSAPASETRAVRGASTHGAQLKPLDVPFDFPSVADSNSPLFWNADRELVLFTSVGHPTLSVGRRLDQMTPVGEVHIESDLPGGKWLEAVIPAGDGTLYGYYHNEPPGVCPDESLTAPQIGAMRSRDDGQTWVDLGIVLTARPGYISCDTVNTYFAGGVGDFSVVLDREQSYAYFFFTTYGGELGEQGVTVARLDWRHRDNPARKLFKYFAGEWKEPGLGGAATAIFPALTLWEEPETDAFWGPSVHWNSSIGQFVMLLNHDFGSTFANEGIWIAFSPSLEDPTQWSDYEPILEGGDWYPQVVGFEPGRGSDRVAGAEAWFCVRGRCSFQISFAPRAAAAVAGTLRAGSVAVSRPAQLVRSPSRAWQPRRRRPV